MGSGRIRRKRLRQNQNNNKKPLRKHKALRRQLKAFKEQGDIGLQIAQDMLDKFVEKGIVTGEEAEKIAFDLKI